MGKKKINKELIKKIMLIGCTSVSIIIVGFAYKIEKDSDKNTKITIENRNFIENKYSNEVNKESLRLGERKKDILIVNRQNSVEKEYIPEDLVVVNVPGIREIELTKEVSEKLEELFRDSRNEGVNLSAVSGYRNYEYQENIFNDSVQADGEEYASKYVAMPGKSEHQTGLAVDLFSEGDVSLTEEFENSPEFKWLDENMHNYGFILRYPKNKEHITGYSYEPWHLRYVGVELATDIKNKGVTLEEHVMN